MTRSNISKKEEPISRQKVLSHVFKMEQKQPCKNVLAMIMHFMTHAEAVKMSNSHF